MQACVIRTGDVVEDVFEAPETVPEDRHDAASPNVTPALLLVGSAFQGGAIDLPRVVRLREALEVGRLHGTVAKRPESRLNLGDKVLSRIHFQLRPVPGGWEGEDAGSLNGTYVDGRRLEGRARLAEGSLLFFGGHAAVFRRVSEDALRAIAEDEASPFGPVRTVSPILATTIWRLRRLARHGAEVLITGETGVGKEVYARAIHRASGRRGRFVAINCAAIPAELAESELFGYVRGAHSTANAAKPGLIQAAEGGTLFLDEIGDMSPRLQAKLLRFLQDREISPLGSTAPQRVDVQIVAATNNAGAGSDLRADLAARLGSQAIRLPPLRDRIEDLGALVHHFLTLDGRAAPEIEPAAFHVLCNYAWPRNVRELEKVIEEAVALAEGDTHLKLAHLPALAATMVPSAPQRAGSIARRLSPTRGELVALLEQHAGNVSEVARSLDRRWGVVWRWMRKHGVDPNEFRT